jgi:NADPH-dependent ferric siderophore reductase
MFNVFVAQVHMGNPSFVRFRLSSDELNEFAPFVRANFKLFAFLLFATIVCLEYLPRPSCPTYFLKVHRLFL